jgi:hypothetical protein
MAQPAARQEGAQAQGEAQPARRGRRPRGRRSP